LIAVCGHTIAFLLSQLQKKSLVTVTEADTLETILDKFKVNFSSYPIQIEFYAIE